MLNSHQPIGIFDSGIGGLTVAQAVHAALPQENIIYFGDTAHTPWGNQSAAAIQDYATKISDILLQANCKVIIVACNSASSSAIPHVKATVAKRALVYDVITPVVEYLVKNFSKGSIGLIGTKRTIMSRAYQQMLAARTQDLQINALATPLLAPMIEEGYIDESVSSQIIANYLDKHEFQDIQALILGCTHYPLIKNQIRHFFADKLQILDSANIVANCVKQDLISKSLCNPQDANLSKLKFLVSNDSEFFNDTAQRFFQTSNINLETYDIFATTSE